jgi:hypothetical protein
MKEFCLAQNQSRLESMGLFVNLMNSQNSGNESAKKKRKTLHKYPRQCEDISTWYIYLEKMNHIKFELNSHVSGATKFGMMTRLQQKS